MLPPGLWEVVFIILFLLQKQITSGRKSITLLSLHYDVRVRSRLVESDVTAVYSNLVKKGSQSRLYLPLPEEAYITSLSLQIDGKNYTGVLTKKRRDKKNKNNYKQDLNTVQLHQRSGRSQRFTINAYLKAGSALRFQYSYTELLHRRRGQYPLIFYVPNQAPRHLKINLLLLEVQKLEKLKFLYSNGEEDILIKILHGQVKVHLLSETEIRLTYEAFGKKSTFSSVVQHETDSDFQMSSSFNPVSFDYNGESSLVLSEPSYIFLYDIARYNDAGEIQIQNGYFVHFIAPEGLPKLAVHTVFVLDISGSMDEFQKLENLKLAMTAILARLRSEDSFEVFVFSNGVGSLGVYTSSKRDVANGVSQINNLFAHGATNINDALLESVQGASRHKYRKGAKQIVFLTDGNPTVGEKDTEKIRQNLKAANEEELSIYTLGFGDDADMRFLRQISAENRGFARKIRSDGRPADQLRDFYEEISTPLMMDLRITYDPAEVDNKSLVKYGQDNFYSGDEIVVTGKLLDGVTDLQPKVEGKSRNGRIQLMLPRKQTLERHPKQDTLLLERLWAYLAVQDLLSSQELIEDGNVRKEMRSRALELALRYNFVTRLTSLVMKEQPYNLYYLHSREDALGIGNPSTGSLVGEAATAHNDYYDDFTNGISLVGPEDFAATLPNELHMVIPPSTNRRYSFVDNDPHFVVQVPGLELPLCFDLHGQPDDVLSLVKDAESGIIVNAEVSAAIGRPRATYFTKIYISIEEIEIIVDTETIEVKCSEEVGQIKISDMWQEMGSFPNTKRKRINPKKRHGRQAKAKRSYPPRKKRHKRRWLKRLRGNACSRRSDYSCNGPNLLKTRRRPRNTPLHAIRHAMGKSLYPCPRCKASREHESARLSKKSNSSFLEQERVVRKMTEMREESYFEGQSPFIDSYLEKNEQVVTKEPLLESSDRNKILEQFGESPDKINEEIKSLPEAPNDASKTFKGSHSTSEHVPQSISITRNHCNQSVRWQELSKTSYDDVLLIVKGRRRRHRLDIVVGDVKVHFVIMNTRNKAGQSFLGFYIQEQTILSPCTSGVIGQFVYKSVGTVGYFPELSTDPENQVNRSIPLVVVHLPQGGKALSPRVTEVESVVSKRLSLLHRTKVLCLHVRHHGRGLLARPAHEYLLPCLSCH